MFRAALRPIALLITSTLPALSSIADQSRALECMRLLESSQTRDFVFASPTDEEKEAIRWRGGEDPNIALLVS